MKTKYIIGERDFQMCLKKIDELLNFAELSEVNMLDDGEYIDILYENRIEGQLNQATILRHMRNVNDPKKIEIKWFKPSENTLYIYKRNQ